MSHVFCNALLFSGWILNDLQVLFWMHFRWHSNSSVTLTVCMTWPRRAWSTRRKIKILLRNWKILVEDIHFSKSIVWRWKLQKYNTFQFWGSCNFLLELLIKLNLTPAAVATRCYINIWIYGVFFVFRWRQPSFIMGKVSYYNRIDSVLQGKRKPSIFFIRHAMFFILLWKVLKIKCTYNCVLHEKHDYFLHVNLSYNCFQACTKSKSLTLNFSSLI